MTVTGRRRLPEQPRVVTSDFVVHITNNTSPPLLQNRWLSYQDFMRRTVRHVRWLGQCAACDRATWGHDDGEDDPRGILGDGAASPVEVEVNGQTFAVRCCFGCANDQRSYLYVSERMRLMAERERWDSVDHLSPVKWPQQG